MFSPCLNKGLAIQAAPRNSWHFRNWPRIFSTLLISLFCSQVCLNPMLLLWISLGWGMARGWWQHVHASRTHVWAVPLAQESRICFPSPEQTRCGGRTMPNLSDLVTRERASPYQQGNQLPEPRPHGLSGQQASASVCHSLRKCLSLQSDTLLNLSPEMKLHIQARDCTAGNRNWC